ncbi:XRCC1 [Branchiostoma lanceolatum]|uniref:DNA repair protein XRCC1 n=1 Tax=Branchiostoma lanceolatum TaxID=7740 RepID=A0A8J9ZUI4_BRALA|nr:XRCC1 [Branchiostoma lanceolatum]
MPEIQLQKVVSFSSEDKNHTAENLLKSETYRKWKCSAVGEKQASAIIQFDEPAQIHSIDIGNEHSAFVEILVGRASAQTDQDYQVLLVASSFMSPAESKQGNNPHRVRMFSIEKLSNSVKDQKWDRVKIVCTQPFNKNVQYGLSFIKFHSPPSGSPQAKKNPTPKKLGKFALKDDDGDEDKVTIGSFFSKKGKTEQKPLTGAAAVRAASSAVATATTTSPRPAAKMTSPSSQSTKRKLPRDDDDDDDNKPPLRKHQSTPSKGASPPPMKKTKSDVSIKQPTNKATPSKTPPTTHPQKRKPAPKPRMKEEEEEGRDFGSLMEDVVFVLSGYVNPQRAGLRDKAMEMGASYKSDWDPTCTHLVCAFTNTPKYIQVQKKGGKIVSHKWIEHCYKKRVLLSWKRFRLDDDSSSSSEEEDDPPPKPKPKPRTTPAKPAAASSSKGASPSKTTVAAKPSPAKKASPAKAVKKEEEDDDYGDSTDVDSDAGPSPTKKRKVQDTSGDDTEDEIRRIQEQNKKIKEEDQYAGSTDEESEHATPKKTTPKKSPAKTPQKQTHGNGDADDMPLPDLPDFFTGKNFFLYGDFPASERRLVLRYITAFNGSMEDYMCDKVTHVITNEEWDDNFDEALSDNCDLTFVRPQWVYKCSERGKMVPHQPYIVVPKA